MRTEMRLRLSPALGSYLLLAAGLVWISATPAGAIQYTPGVGDTLNTFQSGDPGSPFNTGPGGVDYDGIGSGDPHPGEAVVTGEIPSLWINGSTQVTFTTADIVFTLEAQLASATVTVFSATSAQLVATFTGTADGQPDLVLTDPTDSTVLLESNLVAGTLNGNPVAPITAIVNFNPSSPPAQPNGQAFAFFQTIVNGNPWEPLFDDGVGTLNDEGIAQTLISNFVPGFDTIAATVQGSGVLPSFEAEANGFIFKLDDSQFTVPEPGTLLLLAGVLGVEISRRRRTRARTGR